MPSTLPKHSVTQPRWMSSGRSRCGGWRSRWSWLPDIHPCLRSKIHPTETHLHACFDCSVAEWYPVKALLPSCQLPPAKCFQQHLSTSWGSVAGAPGGARLSPPISGCSMSKFRRQKHSCWLGWQLCQPGECRNSAQRASSCSPQPPIAAEHQQLNTQVTFPCNSDAPVENAAAGQELNMGSTSIFLPKQRILASGSLFIQ